MASHAVKNFIRNRDFFKIASSLETGADHGMWSLHRYRTWLENRGNWFIPGRNAEAPEAEPTETVTLPAASLPFPLTQRSAKIEKKVTAPLQPQPPGKSPGRIEIEPVEGEFGKILKRPGE